MLTIGAEGFRIVKKQNVLFHGIVDYEKAQRQHAEVVKLLERCGFLLLVYQMKFL